jgi:hypothetical protein
MLILLFKIHWQKQGLIGLQGLYYNKCGVLQSVSPCFSFQF